MTISLLDILGFMFLFSLILIFKMAVCVGRTPLASEIGLENIGLKTDEDVLVTHGGSNGEITGEVAIPLLKQASFSVDPGSWYDSTLSKA